uniref:RanBP2-type domain-containing protein n=1 Tax=Wuchereria bancrofti TaxID=6293 RepID=A0A1I8EJ85_WUCBA
MTERKTGGWLSSVVDNISGLWSRSPTESAVTSRESTDIQNSSRDSSYEEQSESDVGEEDDDIIIETVYAGSSTTVPTTSRNRNDITPKQHTVRYLSPSAILAATRSVTNSSDKEALTSVNRKRAATSCIFENDIMCSNTGNAFTTSSMMEPLSSRSTKRSRIQRDFGDERSFLSLSSLSDVPQTGRSHLNQSFASSFTPLNSLVIKPRVSRPCSSATSSLSSKTRAILEQLEKISSPVREVKRLSSFNLDGPERWATDTISTAVQKPPRNSMCTLSRAQLISNILSTKSSSPSRPAYSAKMADSSTTSHPVQIPEYNQADANHTRESNKVPTTESSCLSPSKKADFLTPPSKPDREKVFTDDNVEKSTVSAKDAALSMSDSAIKTADIVLPQRSSSTKSTNVFSARALGVVSPVKEMMRNDKDKLISTTKVDGAMFAFAPPMKRGPSASFHREETATNISRSIPSFTKTTFKATAEKAVDGFSFPTESVSEQIKDALSVKHPSEKSEQWSCPKCMVFNKTDIAKCVCCGYENMVESKPWTCSECWISNKSTDDKCIACGNPKQSNGKGVKLTDISVKSSSFTNVFGDRTFKPVPSTGGISFGFSAAKPGTDESSLSLTTSAPATTKALNPATVVNGNTNTEASLKFGLSSSTSTPNFGFGKAPETNCLPTVTEEQPSMLPSHHPPSASLNFGVSFGSVTTASFVPSLTRSSLSFPTLTVTTSAATTLPLSESTFSIPVSINTNPFTFGSSSTTTAEEIKTATAPLFSFGSSFPAVTTDTSAVTTTTSLPLFGAALPELPTPKAPLFGASGGSVSSPEASHDVVEMSSPTTSPVAPSATVGSFGVSKSSNSLFSFGASNTSNPSTGTLFGNLQTTVQNLVAAPSTSLFSFGQQQTPVAPKPFEPPASLTSPPSAFNFGTTASNGAAGFVFGSTSPPPSFTFGAQQPVNNAASTTFNFTPAAAAPSFGNIPGSAPTTNFFSVGSTSSTTTRKMLKARRMRK